MKKILLPIYLLLLVGSTLPSLIRLSLGQTISFRLLLSSLLFVGLVIFTGGRSRISDQPILISVSPATSNLAQDEKKWRFLYQIQPTHRDVLINLAKINQALGKAEQAAAFFKQATLSDPNHPEVSAISTSL